MADRTVSARLRLDVNEYIADARRAEEATRRIADQAERSGARIRRSQQQQRRSSEETGDTEEAAARRAARAAEQQARAQEQATRAQLSAEEAAERAAAAQRRAAEAAEALARGEITEEQAAEAATRARRAQTRATLAQEEAARRAAAAEEDHTEATRDGTDAAEDSAAASNRAAGGLLELAIAGGAAGAAVVSAGVAVSAFGLLAGPSIGKVIKASQELGTEWNTLSAEQKVAAAGVNKLGDEYKALAKSFEPQAMSAFNSVLATSTVMLPKLGKVADTTGDAVVGFIDAIGNWVSGPQVDEFVAWSGRAAPAALGQLGTAATSTGTLALRLIQDLEPIGMSMLMIANGGLAAANALAKINPAFAQLALLTLMLRRPIMGAAAGIAGMSTRVGGMATRMRAGSGAASALSKASRVLNLVTMASPALLVAAGVGLAFLAVKTMNAKSSTEKFIDVLRSETQATGNNLAGHKKFAAQLDANAKGTMARIVAAQNNMAASVRNSSGSMTEHTYQVGQLRQQYKETSKALKEQRETIRDVENGANALASKYGITQQQALALATAAGVDLTKAMEDGGKLTTQAAAKINNYRVNVEAAKNPTQQIAFALADAANEALAMKDRVTALTAALDAQFNPSLAVFNATTQMREGFRKLSEEFAKAKGRMDGNTEASLRLRQTFGQQLQTVSELAKATHQQSGSLDKARASIAQQIPVLLAVAGGNKEARDQVEKLAQAYGINTSTLTVSRQAFIAQASAMLGSKAQAAQLWVQYQKLNASQRSGTAALGGYITRLQTSATAAGNLAAKTGGAHGKQQAYNTKIRESLPVLYALAGRSSAARTQVDNLARAAGGAAGKANVSKTAFMNAANSMGIAKVKAEALWREYNKLPGATGRAAGGMQSFKKSTLQALKEIGNQKPTVSVKVSARGDFRRSTTAGLNAGGPVPWLDGAEAGKDSVPAMLTPDEHVWTTAEVARAGGHGAVERLRAAALRGELAGYNVGGAVGMRLTGNRAAGAQKSRWARDQHIVVWKKERATYDQAASLAAAWKKFAGDGGPVVAAARSQIGLPYSWGGGGPGGPSYGIGRGAGTMGFDCSGLTEYAWWQGRRVGIGGVTYSQHPNSVPIGAPRPGALGFNASLGHVVLASNRPGMVIEAPYTGGHVREVHKSMPDWRWPKGAGYADGGQVRAARERRIGEAVVRGNPSEDEVLLAKVYGIASDPGRMPGYAAGGWVRGRPGTDQNVIAASDGEYVINKTAAAENQHLVEAINDRTLGTSITAPRRLAPASSGGRPAGGSSGGRELPVYGDIHVHNHGVIGSKLETQNWLADSLDALRRQGRA